MNNTLSRIQGTLCIVIGVGILVYILTPFLLRMVAVFGAVMLIRYGFYLRGINHTHFSTGLTLID